MDLNPTSSLITVEETHYSAAVSADQLAQKLGELFNMLLQNADNYAIGSYCQSMLDETQFQAIKGSGWVLADGRSVTGSQYETITGNSNIPDARGCAIRGKNNGRSTTTGNPFGEIPLGDSSANSSTKSHDHPVIFSNNSGYQTATDQSPSGIGSWPRVTQVGQSYVVTLGGVTGTTPPSGYNATITTVRSIVVNTFIRID